MQFCMFCWLSSWLLATADSLVFSCCVHFYNSLLQQTSNQFHPLFHFIDILVKM
uniref:Uncharacterized protein n=1 Tax=Octopus bimaculoides TaxID=37653 RepID=A0A0L8HYT2_OCTBM